MNARLKDEFGGNDVWVRTPTKVMSDLMFDVSVLSADQLMQLLRIKYDAEGYSASFRLHLRAACTLIARII